MNSKRIRLTACACLAALAAPHGARAFVAAPRSTPPRQEAAAPAPQDADLARGRALLDAGDAKAAARAFKVVAERRREDADAWYLLGVALIQDGDARGARKAFETAAKLRPAFGRAHAGLALSLLAVGKPRDAEQSAARALDLDAGAPEAHYVLAVLRLARDEFARALEAAEAAVKGNPKFAAAHLVRARALMAYRSGRPAPPSNREELRQRRVAHATRLREAAESLEKFLQLSPAPRDEALWRQQLEALRYYAQYADEQEELNTARSLYAVNDDETDAQFKRAVILSKPEPGVTEEARQHNASGRVLLRVVLAADGTVRHPLVLRGLPYGLTEKAISAARAIKFKPAQRGGQPVSQYVTLEYGFNFY